MNSPLSPLSDYVVAVPEEASSKTVSGIYLPDNATEKPKTALVIATGKEVKQVKSGEKIVYKSYSTTEVKIESQEYILVKEEDILAIVK
ncbi:co-chaperone GroES [Patescibacteria group bacterium]|nr:co-chaperone GroES [Patescibacteria group bacterium]